MRMSRRKGEINARINERDFPHIVELQLQLDRFHDRELEIAAFHRGRGIPVRRDRGARRTIFRSVVAVTRRGSLTARR